MDKWTVKLWSWRSPHSNQMAAGWIICVALHCFLQTKNKNKKKMKVKRNSLPVDQNATKTSHHRQENAINPTVMGKGRTVR